MYSVCLLILRLFLFVFFLFQFYKLQIHCSITSIVVVELETVFLTLPSIRIVFLLFFSVSSTLPPGVLPVMGVCSDILPYKFAQSEPLFPLATSIPTARATELLASPIGQCSSLPAMCSLFYPPLPESNTVLCRDTCSELPRDCMLVIGFFLGLSQSTTCLQFPERRDGDDVICIGGNFLIIFSSCHI